ncbi:MAG TPA: type I DNA topoisomerase, partial [Candidatus Atribacteria bacterium]|nr:type I DNA topoisomerase [Candidatus Atribacteria bacterium]
IRENFGKEYLFKGKRKYKKKEGAQEAHEAIRPTNVSHTPDSIRNYLTPDQYKLYNLIWSRFLATQFKDAKIAKTKVWIKNGDYLFLLEGEVLVFPGYTIIYNDISSKDVILPDFMENEEVSLVNLIPTQHFTKPPVRYNEATLVKVLEEKGIGRPSTYAQIISTIQARRYVEKRDKKYLFPTELGEIVNSLLVANFPDIINVNFTAKMEEELDKIEEGKLDWQNVLKKFYTSFLPALEEAREKIKRIKIEKKEEFSGEFCEVCGKPMVIRHGRYGDFLACSGYPECKNTKPILKKIGISCPKKGCNGEIVEKISKKGRKYYTCTNYPECDFISFNKPVNKFCPKCGSILVEIKSKGKKYLKCSNPECDYIEEYSDNKKEEQTEEVLA